MNRIAMFVGVGLLAIIIATSSLFVVDQRQVAAVFTLGEIRTVITEPGLYFHWPLVQTVSPLDKRVQTLNSPEARAIFTAEKKSLVIDWMVKWRIRDPRQYIRSNGVSQSNLESRLAAVTQAAFNEVLKAGADRDRSKNEGQAYASDVIPRAQGDAAHLREDAIAYKARVVDAAEGDSDRFRAVLAEYQKAPAVTRDRMYIDAMQDVYANVTKVMVDTHGGNNLITLPLDKLVQAGAAAGGAPAASPSSGGGTGTIVSPADSSSATIDPRSRDNARSRDREGR